MEEEGERKKENEKRRSLLPRGEYSNAISMRNIKIPHKSIGTAGSLAYVHRLGVRSITNRIAIERFLRSIHNSFHCSSPRGRSLRQSWVLSTRRRRRRRTRSLDESIIHVWTLSFIGLPGNTERSIDDDSRGPISIAISFPTPLCTCVHVSFSSVCVCVCCVCTSGRNSFFPPLERFYVCGTCISVPTLYHRDAQIDILGGCSFWRFERTVSRLTSCAETTVSRSFYFKIVIFLLCFKYIQVKQNMQSK